MWQSLFETIGKAFDFFGRLFSRKQPEQPPEPLEPLEQDVQAARAGTAAGAAAHEAGHIVSSK